jgi:hypothetical protein
MKAARRFFLSNRFAIAIAMMLLFPMAQMAATTHLISHIHIEQNADIGSQEGKVGHHQDHCDLCQTALAALAGAANSHPVGFSAGIAPQGTRKTESWVTPTRNVWPSYESRAPPLS